MMLFVAPLRGINVGGRILVSMRDIAGTLREAGCANVSTHGQSGNVLFETDGTGGLGRAVRVTCAVVGG
ncbi:DUF1697 domain-containing protein [Microbacterium sp. A94]|uniref:DUF1697 domain-containing protein n=1 Tax=Microbacterium sp. A94 TaxID=3450717 RepID=UPI003F4352AE